MYIGADYYPEHWPESRWETDAKLMKKAGFNIVRLAEFAWSEMEPAEGRYEFGWLDRALKILGRHGIKAILGTPTASMPPWVARKYPDVMAMKKDGTREAYGHRKYNCFSSGAYRLLSKRITNAMTRYFRRHPGVIGWQTDNEFDSHPCYCDNCQRNFQDWLRKKHGTIEKLNNALGTRFWSHKYGDFNEIWIPATPITVNPALALEHKRFQSDLNVLFQRDQVRIIRRRCKNHFVIHNFQESYKDIDYYELAKDLDLVSWNSYPIWGEPGLPYGAAAMGDVLRGLKRKNFWTMEQVCGNQGWAFMSRSVRPGEVRRLFFQQVAHGADGFLWFRWRTCPFGWEQNAHGVLSYDGVPRRRYRECAAVAHDCHKIEKEIEGTMPKADVAVILDYECSWAIGIQPGFVENAPGWWLEPGQTANLNNYHSQFMRYYRALLRAGVNIDFVHPDGDISGYKLVVAPELILMPPGREKKLIDYVRKGGVLVTDLRTGLKDEFNNAHQRLLPGRLRPVLKIRIEEYESLPSDAPIVGGKEFPGRYRGHIGCDWVIPEGAKVLAGYGKEYLEDYAAVTLAKSGRGRAYYVGTIAREDEFYDALVGHALKSAGVKPLTSLPAGVELVSREKKGSRLLFFINHNETAKTVKLPAKLKAKALLGQPPRNGTLALPGNGATILRTT